MARYGVVFGGPSPEHEISILTGLQAARLLHDAGEEVTPLYWSKEGGFFICVPTNEAADFVDGAPRDAKRVTVRVDEGLFTEGFRPKRVELDAVLNCLHGGPGEGGGAAAIFDTVGIPVTGGTVFQSALGMDKLAFAGLLAAADIPVLPRELLTRDGETHLSGPFIVKPRYGGSSIGIEIVDDLVTARALLATSKHLRDGAVIEPFRTDLFDLNIAYRTYPTFQLSAIERPESKAGAIYTFDEKYLHRDGLAAAPRELPAHIPDALAATIRDLARRVAVRCGVTGVVRVDILTDGVQAYVGEINTVPGAMSLYLWTDTAPVQVLRDALVEAVSLRRAPIVGHRNNAALQVAGGIAQKLSTIGADRR